MLFLGSDMLSHGVFSQSNCANSYTTSLTNQVCVFLQLPFYPMRIIPAAKLSPRGMWGAPKKSYSKLYPLSYNPACKIFHHITLNTCKKYYNVYIPR